MKGKLVVVLMLSLLGSNSFAQDTKWQFKFRGYSQVMIESTKKSFEMPFVKVLWEGNRGNLFFSIELQPRNGNPTNKAFVDYTFHNQVLKLRFGQFSNPFKFAEPGPEEKDFVYYAVDQYYVVNLDDIGVGCLGKLRWLNYYLACFNGTGRNVADNNKQKDFVGYLSLQPRPSLTLKLCYQGGQQPNDWREGEFAHLIWSPTKPLNLQAAIIKRVDLKNYGGFLVSMYKVDQFVQLTGRIAWVTQDEVATWTIGLQIFPNASLKIHPNLMFGRGEKPAWAVIAQLSVL